jgi:hypothetical protein
VLKGPAIATWLYDGAARPYRDSDLLVDPRQLTVAGQALWRLGFRLDPHIEHDELEGFMVGGPHAQTWRRNGDRAKVDLHWRLPGTEATPTSAWELLAAGAEPLRVGGVQAEALSKPARALHIVLHAAQHGHWTRKPRVDLDRALDRLDLEVWKAAAALADDLGAATAFAAGLRLTNAGGALADRLGLPPDLPVAWALRAGTSPPKAEAFILRWDHLVAAQGTRARLRSGALSLVPPVSYMERSFPIARHGRLGLCTAYLFRVLRALGRAPWAWRAIRHARASTARSS